MHTVSPYGDHIAPNDCLTWEGSYNERSLILSIADHGSSPMTRTMRTVGTTDCGDGYQEELLAQGPGWCITATDNIDLSPEASIEDQLHPDSMYDCLNFGVLGMVRVYPNKRGHRPGEVPAGHAHGPTEQDIEAARQRAIQHYTFLATHRD